VPTKIPTCRSLTQSLFFAEGCHVLQLISEFLFCHAAAEDVILTHGQAPEHAPPAARDWQAHPGSPAVLTAILMPLAISFCAEIR
jgi:hypothetical protein